MYLFIANKRESQNNKQHTVNKQNKNKTKQKTEKKENEKERNLKKIATITTTIKQITNKNILKNIYIPCT